MYVDLRDKVVVVTGSSKGIGRELVLLLAKLNANVIINYFHDNETAMQTLYDVQKFNKAAIAVRADVSNPKDVLLLYKRTLQKFSKVDVLINNAGIGEGHLISNMSVESWDLTINTNLKGCFLCCKQFAKQMIRQKSGKIINISSQLSKTGEKGLSCYCSSKAGINSLTKTLAIELADYNIAVNAICPGRILTALNSEYPPVYQNSLLNNCNLNDFIHFTTFLISDKIRNVSGQIFYLGSKSNK